MTFYLGTKRFSAFIRRDVYSQKTPLLILGTCQNRGTKAYKEDSGAFGVRSDTLASAMFDDDRTQSIERNGKTYYARTMNWGAHEDGSPKQVMYTADEVADQAEWRDLLEEQRLLQEKMMGFELDHSKLKPVIDSDLEPEAA